MGDVSGVPVQKQQGVSGLLPGNKPAVDFDIVGSSYVGFVKAKAQIRRSSLNIPLGKEYTVSLEILNVAEKQHYAD